MKILITGGTGLIGRSLSKTFHDQGHDLIVLTRNPRKAKPLQRYNAHLISNFDQIDKNEKIDIVINLAGEPIANKRWTKDQKRKIWKSRIETTTKLVELIGRLSVAPKVLISGSAVGYYGDCGDRKLNELSNPHDEFSHQLCAAWEMQAVRAKAFNTRVCILRTGLVLANNDGFLKKMLPSFKLGLGATLGNGKQWMSWIHINDFINIIHFLLKNESLSGVFNAAAPNPVTNKIFTKSLGSALRRPTLFVMPGFMLKKMFGEMSTLLLTGQRVIPEKLLKARFEFAFPTLDVALENVLKKSRPKGL